MDGLAIHPLILHGYGLVEAAFEPTAERFGSNARPGWSSIRVVSVTNRTEDALDYLSVRTVPATRLVVVDRGEWTAILTNHRNGSDFADHQYRAGISLGVRSVRVVDSEARWWRRGELRHRLGYAARILELRGPNNTNHRSIACADDGGKWVFDVSGDPLPIEASFAYDSPRKKDRFTRSNLHDMLTAIGPGQLDAQTFLNAPRFALLGDESATDAMRDAVAAAACSLGEADDPAFGYYRRGMSYVPHMATHAASVIADFERAMEFNPEYEPRVRDHLREARRIGRG